MSTRKFESGYDKRKKKKRVEDLVQSQKDLVQSCHLNKINLFGKKKSITVQLCIRPHFA